MNRREALRLLLGAPIVAPAAIKAASVPAPLTARDVLLRWQHLSYIEPRPTCWYTTRAVRALLVKFQILMMIRDENILLREAIRA